jgi:hypothetical protein
MSLAMLCPEKGILDLFHLPQVEALYMPREPLEVDLIASEEVGNVRFLYIYGIAHTRCSVQ